MGGVEMIKGIWAAAAAAAMVAVPAQAACWTADEASAAGIRQLQSMLMVTALRCQAAGEGMMVDYNQFVSANRQAIMAENDRIRTHFIHAQGAVLGQHAYDSFTTSMANGYGAGEGAPTSCNGAADLAREASAMAGSRDALLLLVSRLQLEARLPEGRCEARAPMAVASAAPGPGIRYAAAGGRPSAMVATVAYASANTAPLAPAMLVADVDPR
jgi:hypothetical protein